MPAPLQFIRMASIFGSVARLLLSPFHLRARSLGWDRQDPWVSHAAGGDRKRFAGVLVLGCMLAGCTAVDQVTEPLTSPPGIPTLSPGPATTAVEDPAIAIEKPLVGGEVGTPVSVTGTAEVVDAALTIRVLGEDGNELAAIVVRASCGDGCRGTFGTQLFYFIERKQPGTIEVYGIGESGERALASVPVVLFPP
jgi:Immunoglobulin-like domain of bacterial spore germination